MHINRSGYAVPNIIVGLSLARHREILKQKLEALETAAEAMRQFFAADIEAELESLADCSDTCMMPFKSVFDPTALQQPAAPVYGGPAYGLPRDETEQREIWLKDLADVETQLQGLDNAIESVTMKGKNVPEEFKALLTMGRVQFESMRRDLEKRREYLRDHLDAPARSESA